MMNDWYQSMVDALQLNGKGERTQQAYTRSVSLRVCADDCYSRSGSSCLGNNNLIDRAWPAVRVISPFLSRDSTI